MKYVVIVFVSALFVISGCAWVDLTPEGKKIRVLSKTEVSQCKSLGTTTVSVADKVAGVKRQPHIIADNLQTLASNSAAEMNGDTIVADSAIVDGKQKFHVYRCVGP